MFGDSVEGNLEVVKELLQGMPPSARGRARAAAVAIENTVVGLKKDNSRDPATALGVAFAIFMLSKRLVEGDTNDQGSGENLIQLLS